MQDVVRMFCRHNARLFICLSIECVSICLNRRIFAFSGRRFLQHPSDGGHPKMQSGTCQYTSQLGLAQQRQSTLSR